MNALLPFSSLRPRFSRLLRAARRRLTPRAMGALSTPMGEHDIQEFVDAVDAVIAEQLPRWRANGSVGGQ